MTQALLFDFNGVLVDDEEHHCETLRDVLRAEGIDLSREEYYAHYLGFDDRMALVEAFRRAHRTPMAEYIDRIIVEKSRAYEERVRHDLALVPGAAEFVARAAERFRLGVVSGALRREIELILDTARLRRYFEVIVAAEDVRMCKPAPEGYLAARAGLGERATGSQPPPPARCIVIEDSLPGLAAARAAGMPCVMLTTSHPARALHGADLIWDSFAGHDPDELLRLIGP